MATTQLISVLPPTGWSLTLAVSDEIAGERGQQIRVKQLGPDLWIARFASDQMITANARKYKAMIQQIMVARTTFYAWDPRGQYPAADPKGVKIVAPNNIQINSLNADNQRISLKGLPAAYVLTIGDYLSFPYGAAPARAFHQIVPPSPDTVVANGAGLTAEFYVAPRIRVGASVTTVVALKQPVVEMMVVPGSYVADEGPRTASISFNAIQVLP